MDREARLEKYLWDFFVIAQLDILSAIPDEREHFLDFISGKRKDSPFKEGSTSYEVCKLCGKL